MTTRILRLIYPPSLISEPILYQLINRFQIKTNIRQAQISLDEGWLEVELDGEATEIDQAVKFLEKQGIEIIHIN